MSQVNVRVEADGGCKVSAGFHLRHTCQPKTGRATAAAWSADGGMLAIAAGDAIELWGGEDLWLLRRLQAPSVITCLACSGDSRLLATGLTDGRVVIWELASGLRQRDIKVSGRGEFLAWSPSGPYLAVATHNGTLSVWDAETGKKCWSTKRGSSQSALTEDGLPPMRFGFGGSSERAELGMRLAFSPEGAILVCTSRDTGLSLWEVASGKRVGSLRWHYDFGASLSVALSPDGTHAASGSADSTIRIWDLRRKRQVRSLEGHTDMVVGLSYSSDGKLLASAGRDNTVCCWHGETAPSLVKFLVAARGDRGGPAIGPARLQQLRTDLGFDGYFETSSLEGQGIEDLADAIRQAIDWHELPRVSSTELFRQIKEFLLEEKRAGRLLSTVDDLYRTFLRSRAGQKSADDLRRQFDVCIGLVESRGLIRRLSFGNLVLLQPELLDSYASALVNAAREEPDGLGSIHEEAASSGGFRMPQQERLTDRAQEKLLLIAMIEDLLRFDIALREQADDGPHLVFPSQLTREYPDLSDPQGKAVTLAFEGPVLNVYATLAVRLSHSGLFKKKEMWKNAATYLARIGGTCGIVLRELQEGAAELTLTFDDKASRDTRLQFEAYVQAHLQRRAIPESIRCRRVTVCPSCTTPLTDTMVSRRRDRGLDFINCSVCDERIPLPDSVVSVDPKCQAQVPDMDLTVDKKREIDLGLVSAVGQMRTRSFSAWAGGQRSTLALVFTDIVGSVELGISLGDEAMMEVTRDHFKQARRLIEQHGGFEVRTIGDAFMVAFRSAIEAVDFVLSLAVDPGDARLQLRSGVHVGTCHIQGNDAYGAMVNYTARVQTQAPPGEICVSKRVKDDLDDIKARQHQQLKWTVHENCGLKGFAGPQTLWSVPVRA